MSRHNPANQLCRFDPDAFTRGGNEDTDFCTCPPNPDEECRHCGRTRKEHNGVKCPPTDTPTPVIPFKDIHANIVGCARCGGEHPGLAFDELERHFVVGPLIYSHWAACPTNGQPILMSVVATPTAQDG